MHYDTIVSDLDILGDIVGRGRMGDVDIVGDDAATVMEALGALSPQQAQQLASRMHQARNIDPDAISVRQQLMRRYGIQIAGTTEATFDPAVPASLVQTVELRVSRPFKPLQPILGSSIASKFKINNAQVNGVNQFASSGPVPGESFSEVSYRVGQKWDTVNPSFPLTLEVELVDLTAKVNFVMAFTGYALLK